MFIYIFISSKDQTYVYIVMVRNRKCGCGCGWSLLTVSCVSGMLGVVEQKVPCDGEYPPLFDSCRVSSQKSVLFAPWTGKHEPIGRDSLETYYLP